MPQIEWNNKTKLIFSDVDGTLAESYGLANPDLITELNSLLSEGTVLFMSSGGSLAQIKRRITDLIDPKLRHLVLIAHCNGAELCGFTPDGELRSEPTYSLYKQQMTEAQSGDWREAVSQLISEFKLRTHDPMPKARFHDQIGFDPQDVMYEDRGPQITFEFVNATDLSSDQQKQVWASAPLSEGERDLRVPVMERAKVLFTEAKVPIVPSLGGECALDLGLKGISKSTAIRYMTKHPDVLESVGLEPSILDEPTSLEIWGDRFIASLGGTDRYLSEALPSSVRSIDFRDEDSSLFSPGLNIVVWNGEKHLQDGVLEYLQTRNK